MYELLSYNWIYVAIFTIPLIVFLIFFSFVRRTLRSKLLSGDRVERCPCGYPPTNLTIARCPECGRIPGFNSKAEDLGLTRQQLERAHQAKERRSSS